MTIDELKLIAAQGFMPSLGQVEEIYSGKIKNNESRNIELFQVVHGNDISLINDCEHWQEVNLNQILTLLNDPTVKKEDIPQMMMVEDYHWNWINKSFLYRQDEYDWFYIRINGNAESVCITYHPKDSATSNGTIYYIEYLAVAPWNRFSALHPKKYSGLGTEILKQIQIYFNTVRGYTLGFSLHSLPQARKYYELIGMTYLNSHDKPGLFFYEIDAVNAGRFVGGIK